MAQVLVGIVLGVGVCFTSGVRVDPAEAWPHDLSPKHQDPNDLTPHDSCEPQSASMIVQLY